MTDVFVVAGPASFRDQLVTQLSAREVTVRATGATAAAFLDLARRHPDAVALVDLQSVPRAVAIIRQLVADHRHRVVALAPLGDAQGLDALDAGAACVVPRDPSLSHPLTTAQADRCAGAIRAVTGLVLTTRNHVGPRSAPLEPPALADPVLGAPRGAPGVIGLVASTGGPTVIADILGGLPRQFTVPVLIVQHITTGFGRGFVRWLRGETARDVRFASSGEAIARGIVYVAPDDHHLVVREPGVLRLTDDAPAHGHRPSGSVLLQSLAQSFGSRAVAVVATGMGDDGSRGASDVARAGGVVIVQHPDTAVVDSMPKATLAAVPSAVVVMPGRIAELLQRLTVR